MDRLESTEKPGNAKGKFKDDALEIERRRLRQHLGLGPEPGDRLSEPPQTQPLLFIEMTPGSTRVVPNTRRLYYLANYALL